MSSERVTTTWARVLARRVRRHHLDRPSQDGLVAVARRLNGVHAQVLSCAQLALGIRARDVRPEHVERALLDHRCLVKTWAARGTLHLLPADDLPLWVAALSTRTNHLAGSWLRYHEVSADELGAVLDAVPRALEGRCLTREELAAEVARLSGRAHLEERLRASWGAVLKPAAARGLLCFGPSRGRNVTFVLPRDWVATWREVPAQDALAELLRRYLDAYGPATPEEFGRWFGLDPRPSRALFAGLGDELAETDVEGHRAWTTRAAAEELGRDGGGPGPAVVRLLPGFDPYVTGALRQLDHLLPGPFRDRVSRAAGWISPVLLVDGRIAGTWRQDARRGGVAVTVEPFTPLPAGVRAAAEEHAATLAGLLDAQVILRWSAPAV